MGGLFGNRGGAGGTGFNAPTLADIQNPVNKEQISGAYTGVQNSMASQNALLAALQQQNGLGNQSQVYNQMQGVVNGTGPNPARAQLAQATGANVANQASLMAGQRGAGANVGLMARQAAQQGANIQQQSAGQAASLQAQQSLNALNSAGGIANTQASNQIGQTNANVSAQQAEQQALLNAQASYNNAAVSNQSGVNSTNAGLANTTMQGQQAIIGGVMKGAGAAAGMAAEGGEAGADFSNFSGSGPQSKFAQFLAAPSYQGSADISSAPSFGGGSGAQALQEGVAGGISSAFKKKADPYANIHNAKALPMTQSIIPASMPMVAAEGGKVPAMVSPGEKYLSPKEAHAVAQGKEDPAKAGKVIPGKPKFKGNNYANDVIPAELEEGGVVIPNSVMQSKDPARGAADFVRKTLAKKGRK